MKNIIRVVRLFLFCLVFFLGGSTEEKSNIKPIKVVYKQKELVIILHSSLKKNYFMDSSLPRCIKAYDQYCPFIVSTAIIEAVAYLLTYENRSLDYIKQQYLDDLKSKLKIFTYCPQDWCVKEINKELLLYIPLYPYKQKLLSKKNLSKKHKDALFKARVEAIKAYLPDQEITVIEQELGLKVNHMQTVDTPLSIKKKYPFRNMGDEFIDSVWNNRENKSSIFVTNSDYFDMKKDDDNELVIPEWVFYMAGHGHIPQSLAGGAVVDMPIKEFKEWLDFLGSKITTKLLYYSSCYSGGINEKELYKNEESLIEKIYPYTIVAQSLTDIPVYAHGIDFINRLDFINFFNFAFSQDGIDFKKLTNCVALSQKHFSLSELSRVKIKNLPWFSLIDQDKVISVGEVYAKTRKKPLIIKKNKLAFLLYTESIPFEIVCDLSSMPLFVSMLPGSAYHHFYKISSSKLSPIALLDGFFSILEKDYLAVDYSFNKEPITKKIIIDQIQGVCSDLLKKQCFFLVNKKNGDGIVFLDVVIELFFGNATVYFTYNDNYYKAFFQKDNQSLFEKMKDEDIIEYKRLLFAKNFKYTHQNKVQKKKIEKNPSLLLSHQTVFEQLQLDAVSSLDAVKVDTASFHKQVTDDSIAHLEGLIEKKIKEFAQEIEKDVD